MDLVTLSCRIPRVTESTTIRCVANSTITASASANVAGSYNFQLGLANVGTGFYDLYRIEAVRVNIRPKNNAIGLFTNSTTSVVTLYNVIDYDDSANLGSVADAEAYSTCLALAPGQSCSRGFKPRIAMAAYNGAFTGYANMSPQWIDAAYQNVEHYGLKYFIPQATAAQTQLQEWDVSVDYYVSFRKSI